MTATEGKVRLTDEPDDLPPGAADHFYDDDPDFDDEDEEGWDECGMMPDGYCTMAGSEWCDWDCPRSKPAGRAALSAPEREGGDDGA